jgi:aminopeptidase N
VWGKYQWPQLTNVHRIEGGGTEFNMMVHDGSAQLGLILHEGGHNYSQGQLANNEWKEGFLDEGMTSFQTSWYFEEHGQPRTWDRTMQQAGQFEKSGKGQPIATPAIEFHDFGVYNYETYTKPSIVYRMLREYLGRETMLNAMHQYFDKHKLQHVTLQDYKDSMEQVSGKDLTWFFDEWFHSTGTLDYAVSSATTATQADGSWKTVVQVTRSGDNWMPVILKVGTDTRTLDSKERTQTVEVVTHDKPADVVLDPDMILLDTDTANNKKTL